MDPTIVPGVIAGLISAAIVAFLSLVWKWIRDGIGPIRTIRSLWYSLVRNRLVAFYSNRRELMSLLSPVDEYLANAKTSVDYVGLWLSSGLENGALKRALQAGTRSSKHFRACLLDPDSPLCSDYARFFGISELEVRQRIRASVERLREVRDSLDKSERGRMTILLHGQLLTASAFLIDSKQPTSRVLVDHKFQGASRDWSYGFEMVVKSDGLGTRLLESYERILTSAQVVPD